MLRNTYDGITAVDEALGLQQTIPLFFGGSGFVQAVQVVDREQRFDPPLGLAPPCPTGTAHARYRNPQSMAGRISHAASAR